MRAAVGFFPLSLFPNILITKLLSESKFKCSMRERENINKEGKSKGRQVGLS